MSTTAQAIGYAVFGALIGTVAVLGICILIAESLGVWRKGRA